MCLGINLIYQSILKINKYNIIHLEFNILKNDYHLSLFEINHFIFF